MLKAPLDSSSFMKWGAKGAGTWFTIYTNPSHAFMVIAGLRLDTSRRRRPGGRQGPALASGAAQHQGLHGPPPRRLLGRGGRTAIAGWVG